MTAPLAIALAFVFSSASFLLILRWVYLWQLKEYRIDRMRDFFTLPSGKKALFDAQFAVNLVAILTAFALGSLWWVVIAFCVQSVFLFVKRVRPKMTGKAVGVSAASLAVIIGSGALLALLFDATYLLPILLLISPLVVSGFVVSLHPVTLWQRQQVMSRAKQKLQAHQTSVIGITGSFGKSTTKEFLYGILKQRYSVLATSKNINVDIGIANTILNELTDEHDFFIAEMGAYRPGEIASSCRLANPIIGILTAVSGQHLSLYGSIEAIKHAKGELLRALPAGGLAVVNKDIRAAVEVSEEAQSQIKFYSTKGFAHTTAQDIDVQPDQVSFVLHVGDESIPVRAKLHGEQVVPSILAAATVARHVGCTMQEIATGIAQLTPTAGTMHVKPGKHNTTIIDDHYNSNPEGFMAALDYQHVFHGKRKIVLTPGMYELADTTEYHHHSVAQRIAEVADILMITKKDFAPFMKKGAREAGMPESQIQLHTEPHVAIEWLKKNLKPDDVILLEGRVHEQIVNYLLHN